MVTYIIPNQYHEGSNNLLPEGRLLSLSLQRLPVLAFTGWAGFAGAGAEKELVAGVNAEAVNKRRCTVVSNHNKSP